MLTRTPLLGLSLTPAWGQISLSPPAPAEPTPFAFKAALLEGDEGDEGGDDPPPPVGGPPVGGGGSGDGGIMTLLRIGPRPVVVMMEPNHQDEEPEVIH